MNRDVRPLAAAAIVGAVLSSAPRPLAAQAFTPPKGVGAVTLAWQYIDNTGHRMSDGYLRVAGQSVTTSALLEMEYGVSDRVSATLGIPYVFAKYTGKNPPLSGLPVDTCRCWHSSLRAVETDGRGIAVSQETLRQQMQSAEQSGYQGEEIFNLWLESTGHEEDDYEWVSRQHARATHDFHVRNPKWPGAEGETFVEVKSTRAALETPVHMSIAEVRWAATRPNYRIARVHELGAERPRLTMLRGVHELASQIMETITLPAGVKIDGFQIDTRKLTQEFTVEIDTTGD